MSDRTVKQTGAPGRDPGIFQDDATLERMGQEAVEAAQFLKALAHANRMMILCHLAHGEKSVTELEQLLGIRQPAVSQQLSRLRGDGLIAARRDGKAIYYEISDERARAIMAVVYDQFCSVKRNS